MRIDMAQARGKRIAIKAGPSADPCPGGDDIRPECHRLFKDLRADTKEIRIEITGGDNPGVSMNARLARVEATLATLRWLIPAAIGVTAIIVRLLVWAFS